MKRKVISLEKIYLKDERFRISYFYSFDKIISSLNKIGLINPPLVCVRKDRFILVTGWKRIFACLELSLPTIPVFISEGEDDLDIFLYALYENLATRNFSLLEKAEIIAKLEKLGVEKNNIIDEYFPLLGIHPVATYLDIYMVLSSCEPDLKKNIHENNIPFSSIKLLLELRPEERKQTLPLLIPLSLNKQKELLEDLYEISQRDSTSIKEILTGKEIKDILYYEKWSPLEKSERIRLWIKEKRYPNLTSWENAFNSSLKKMNWPKEITLKHQPFFEGEYLSASFRFKNKKDFEECLSKLRKLALKKEFPDIFK